MGIPWPDRIKDTDELEYLWALKKSAFNRQSLDIRPTCD